MKSLKIDENRPKPPTINNTNTNKSKQIKKGLKVKCINVYIHASQ